MSGKDPLLFWLSQESVDSNADIYLPPDTPTQSARVLPQIRKNKRIKRIRTLERLKAYTFEKFEDIRKEQARCLDPARLPPPTIPYGVIEFIEGEEFLVDDTNDIVDLLELAHRVKENGIDSIPPNPAPRLSDDQEEREADLVEKKGHKDPLEEDYKKRIKCFIDQYDRIVSTLLSEEEPLNSANGSILSSSSSLREEGEIDSDSSVSPIIATSPLAPLPPRVSRRDPRLTLKEYNNNASHHPPINGK